VHVHERINTINYNIIFFKILLFSTMLNSIVNNTFWIRHSSMMKLALVLTSSEVWDKLFNLFLYFTQSSGVSMYVQYIRKYFILGGRSTFPSQLSPDQAPSQMWFVLILDILVGKDSNHAWFSCLIRNFQSLVVFRANKLLCRKCKSNLMWIVCSRNMYTCITSALLWAEYYLP
jgi:hypothetical protein